LRRAAGSADPVLRAAELAGRGHVAADTAHQSSMKLAHEAQGQGETLERLDPMIQGADIVRHLAQILRAAFHAGAGFGGEQFTERGLGAFDAAREHGFAADERPDEQVRVGQPFTFAGEPAQEPVGIRERADQVGWPGKTRRQGRRHEGLVAFGTTQVLAGALRHDDAPHRTITNNATISDYI